MRITVGGRADRVVRSRGRLPAIVCCVRRCSLPHAQNKVSGPLALQLYCGAAPELQADCRRSDSGREEAGKKFDSLGLGAFSSGSTFFSSFAYRDMPALRQAPVPEPVGMPS